MMDGGTSGWARRGLVGLAVVAAVGFGASPGAMADEGHARDILKSMSDYLAGQTAISFSYDSDLVVVTTDLQKLIFASSGTVAINRPDKMRVTRVGGFADVAMVYDGKQLSVLGKHLDRYAQVEMTGTIDQLIDHMRINAGVVAPAADLLLPDVYTALMDSVTDVKDLGSGVIGGVECDHLAFRTDAVDWEIWVAMGEAPYPCRYVVTSKMVAMAPEYRIQISDWKTGAAVAADDFAFDPGTATKGTLADLTNIDELPDLTGDAQ